jgi:hypothetical protein
MPHETDLPCSDCGGSLRERDVSPRAVASILDAGTTVVVAECADCGAWHYPDGTIRRLYDEAGPPPTTRGP